MWWKEVGGEGLKYSTPSSQGSIYINKYYVYSLAVSIKCYKHMFYIFVIEHVMFLLYTICIKYQYNAFICIYIYILQKEQKFKFLWCKYKRNIKKSLW
jgi:hypothetical protein